MIRLGLILLCLSLPLHAEPDHNQLIDNIIIRAGSLRARYKIAGESIVKVAEAIGELRNSRKNRIDAWQAGVGTEEKVKSTPEDQKKALQAMRSFSDLVTFLPDLMVISGDTSFIKDKELRARVEELHSQDLEEIQSIAKRLVEAAHSELRSHKIYPESPKYNVLKAIESWSRRERVHGSMASRDEVERDRKWFTSGDKRIETFDEIILSGAKVKEELKLCPSDQELAAEVAARTLEVSLATKSFDGATSAMQKFKKITEEHQRVRNAAKKELEDKEEALKDLDDGDEKDKLLAEIDEFRETFSQSDAKLTEGEILRKDLETNLKAAELRKATAVEAETQSKELAKSCLISMKEGKELILRASKQSRPPEQKKTLNETHDKVQSARKDWDKMKEMRPTKGGVR